MCHCNERCQREDSQDFESYSKRKEREYQEWLIEHEKRKDAYARLIKFAKEHIKW